MWRVWLLVLLLWAVPAWPDERADLQRAVARLNKAAGPTALADVLAVARTVGAVSPGAVLAALEPVGQRWRRNPKLRQTAAMDFLVDLLAELALRSGNPQALARWHTPAGVVTHWSWLGPFGHEHGSAFARDSQVEQEALRVGSGRVQPQATWPGRSGTVSWQTVAAGLIGPTGRMHADEWVEQPDDAIVFLQSFVRVVQPGEVQFRIGAVGPVRVYVDGVRIGQLPERAEIVGLSESVPPLPDVALPPIPLSAGWHRLLVKAGPSQGALPVRVRAVDGRGVPVALESATRLPPNPADVAMPLAVTVTVAENGGSLGLPWPVTEQPRQPSPLPTLLALAWHSWPLESAVTEWLLDLAPTDLPADDDIAVAHALLAAEPGDRIDRLRVWAELLPESAALLVAQASALDTMGKTPQAHRLWQEWSAMWQRQPELESVRACAVRTVLWQRLAGDAAASALLAACGQRWPDAPELLDARIRDAEARDDLAGVAQLSKQRAALEPGRLDLAMQHLGALLAANQVQEARNLAADLAARFPDRSRAYEALARHDLMAREPKLALQDLAHLPGHLVQAKTLELQARALALTGAQDAAVVALKSAVERAPARTDLRWRLAQWQPDGEFYAPYRRDLLALARREHELPRPHPSEDRLQQTVTQAVGNGQQARYEALVRYLGPGCEANQTVEIDYAPTLTRADVLQALVLHPDGRVEPCTNQEVDQFGEDASGMYFDLERLTLRFGGLRPGDTLIVEHVERDLAPTPFGLVFGELMTLADVRPVRELDVAVLLPAGTPVRAQVVDPRPGQPPMPQMQQKRVQSPGGHDAGQWDEWRLQLGPQAAIASEGHMPGVTDVTPYLHISTFATWGALTAWYRQLAAEAIPARGADPVVHAEALRLTQGLATDEDKIRALFAFATTQVRYVGLEFGIHSLKPHAVREVLQRAFGDCKDKATLLVALLAEVGIDAEVVLVRTADNGKLHDGVASLGVFNHAIAYVPKYGLWLDATATHYGIHELPEGDSGGVALRVGRRDEPVAPEILPDGTARDYLQTVKQELKLQADGSVRVDLDFAMHGRSAAEARAQLWSDTSRREQLEQFFSARFPGIVLEDVQMEGIQPLADTVRLRVRARAPDWARRLPDRGWTVQPLRPSQPYVQLFGVQPGRKQPLVLAHPTELAHTTWLLPPPGFAIGRLPAPVDETVRGRDGQPLGQFTLRAELASDGALVLRSHVQLDRRVIAVEDQPALLRLLTTVDSALRVDVPVRPVEAGR